MKCRPNLKILFFHISPLGGLNIGVGRRRRGRERIQIRLMSPPTVGQGLIQNVGSSANLVYLTPGFFFHSSPPIYARINVDY